MKNIFSLRNGVVAFSFVMAGGLFAQNATFEKFMSSEGDDPTLPFTHRTRPAVGDYNNDDFLDLFMGGQSAKGQPEESKFGVGGWYCSAIVLKNNGDGTFQISTKIKNEPATDENPDVAGSPIDDLANLPVSTFSYFRFLDFNNDGNLDLIVRGGSEHNFNVGEYLILLENQGPDHGYKFKQVANHGMIQALNEGFLEGISTGDYNKDGYVDVLLTGYTGDINPPTVKDEEGNEIPNEQYDPSLPSRTGGRYVDLYKNNGGDGTFTLQNIVAASQDGDWEGRFKPMSHSDVRFADLDNDGWLDIVYTGWADNEEGMPRGSGEDIRIYQNVEEGTAFIDVTPLEDPAFKGGSEVTLFVEDLNGDGLLDLILMGDGAPVPHGTAIYLNNGEFSFTLLENEQSGFMTVRACTSGTYADMNHDGKLDAALQGWSQAEGGLFGGVIYQGDDLKFTYDHQVFLPDEPREKGALLAADFFNNGKLDVFEIAASWKSEVAMFKNISDFTNQAPTAPGNVSASISDGMITITWDDATDDVTPAAALFYNVYVKDNNTGKTFMIIPANPETGRLKVISDYQNGVRSTVKEFSMFVNTDSDYNYTVGVQAIDQAQAGSTFATVALSTNIEGSSISRANIEKVKEGFIVKADAGQKVEVVDMLGRVVNTGETNEVITVSGNGLYLISVAGQTYKVIR